MPASIIKLITEEFKLKDFYPDKAKTIAKEYGLKEEDVPFIRKGLIPIDQQFEEGERAVIAYINTGAQDRDGEIVEPKGVILTDYLNHPVVLDFHNYHALPLGKNVWIRIDEKGLLAKTVYATHARAEEVWQYRKSGFPLAESIGFIPLEWEDFHPDSRTGLSRKYTKWILLEYSDVAVPSNPEALEVAIAKGLVKIEREGGPTKDAIKSGRVISEKNRTLIKSCIDQMTGAITSLNELMTATEPEPQQEAQVDILIKAMQEIGECLKNSSNPT